MIEQTDLIIAYVNRTHEGAYRSYQSAQRKHKAIINLSDENAYHLLFLSQKL